ncbi:DUF2062 domain-containing protein [Granulosicoccaceae sp. 1_MG-2023]|nr:DUF2062 domain-containing protein [Granulosicoccaceae sp. 1_MG-2023]
MPRKLLKKYASTLDGLRHSPYLAFLGARIHDPGLWHLNRRSVSGAVAVGLFMCWVPFPFQMVIAAFLAMLFKVNLPISAALVWTTNPVTIPPMFYAAYRLGASVIGEHPISPELRFGPRWIMEKLSEIWLPLTLGSLMFAVVSSLLGFLAVRLFWRIILIRQWQARRHGRRPAADPKSSSVTKV